MQTFWQDIRFALRQLRKSPVFAATAILTLAIGIGANAAISTLIDDAMLRSLPILRPDELVTALFTKSRSATIQGINTSIPPVTPIGFTGMIRDSTRTTVSGKIARSFGGGEVTANAVFEELWILGAFHETVVGIESL